MSHRYRFATRCIHDGAGHDAYGAARPPIYHSTTFTSETGGPASDTDESPPLYTRYGRNPTLYMVERQLAATEDAEAALVFASGMAAISSTCLALGRGGVVTLGNAYGGTLDLLTRQLPALGIATAVLAPDEDDRLEELLGQGYELVLLESPTNPELAVQDIEDVARRAHARGARLVVDNTFATPVNQQPLALGADLVLHSATKFLGGHSDLTAGAAMGAKALLDELDGWRRQLGQAPAPETAALLSRSLATLEVRVQRQNATALQLAQFLAAHPRIARVCYPGLATTRGHAIAARQMSGFGGMLAMEVQGDMAAAQAIVERLELFLDAPSLGGVESLVTQPARTSHGELDPAQRRGRGIGDNLLRVSVGLEDPLDLEADLGQALNGGGS